MASSRLHAAAFVLATLAGSAACNATVDPIGGGPSGTGTGGEGSAIGTSVSTATSPDTSSGIGGSGDGGASGTSSGGGSPTAVGGGSATSIALFESEIPDVGAGGSDSVSVVSVGSGAGGANPTSSGGAGGGAPTGEDLLLVITTGGASCADPYDTQVCNPGTRAYITLPPAVQAPGLYFLSENGITASYSEQSTGAGVCESGATGGGGAMGTIEIVSIDANGLFVRLAGTDFSVLDGEHSVARCNPIIEEGNARLAYFPSDIDGGGGAPSSASVVGVGGSGPGAESLVIDFADHEMVCSDPYASPPDGVTFQNLRIFLPPSYLVPGIYDLDDPSIALIYSQQEQNSASTSGSPGGDPGTLTIFEVTESAINLLLEGTPYDFANGEGEVPRCGG